MAILAVTELCGTAAQPGESKEERAVCTHRKYPRTAVSDTLSFPKLQYQPIKLVAEL
jgi:hypothetical protein